MESTEDNPPRALAPGNAVPTLTGARSSLITVNSPAVDTEVRTLDFEKKEFLELLKQVASIARIGVWELNLETMQPVWSPEVYRIHELSEGTTLTLEQAISYYAPEGRDDIEMAVNRGIRFGTPWDLTLPILTAKGRKIWVRVLGSPESHGGRCVRLFGTIQDITDQRKAEQERLEIERQLIRSQKMEAIGTVAGGVAHEFNNILGGIIGALELIRIRFSMPGTELYSYVDAALGGCQRAAGIIRQMLSFSREECGEKQPFDLRDLIKEALPLLRAGANSGVELRVNSPDAPVSVSGDRSQLYQVLVNLVTNAVQALPNGRGVVDITCGARVLAPTDAECLDGLEPGEYSSLVVADSGCGISDDALGRIFDPFFTTKPVGEGTGLGLSVVHGIVRAHEGTIIVDTEEGKGSTFTILLPRSESDAQQQITKEEEGVLRVGRGQEILVIDDEEALASVTTQLLELSGYVPTATTDPREALSLLRAEPNRYSAILVDYSMPHMTGPELVKHARAAGVKAPVLLTTGLHDQELDEVVGELEIVEILKKPLPASEIISAFSRILNEPA